MIYSELPLAFPWYNNLYKQNRFRRNCLNVKPFKLITPNDALLPFQLYRAGDALKSIAEWKVFNSDGSMVKDLIAEVAKLNNKLIDDKQYTWYKGDVLSLDLPCGFYYSRIRYDEESVYYFSEVFFISNFSIAGNPDFLRITYKHTCDIGPVKYASMDAEYQNILFLDTFLTHTEPAYIEEVEKDGFGNETVVFNKFQNRYITQFIVPDYLKTAIVVLQIHKAASIVTNNAVNAIAVNRLFVKTSIVEDAGGCESLIDLTIEDNC